MITVTGICFLCPLTTVLQASPCKCVQIRSCDSQAPRGHCVVPGGVCVAALQSDC